MSGRDVRSSNNIPKRSGKQALAGAPVPARLPFSTSRVMLATTALVTVTALAVGVAAPATVDFSRPEPQAAAALAPRAMSLEVQLASMVGIYGVGPVFQALRLAGVGSPDAVLTNAVGLLNDPSLSSAVKTLLDVLNTISPVEPKVPGFGPAGVHDSVNELSYSMGAFSGLEGVVDTLNEQ